MQNDYLPPKINMISICIEQAIMTSSLSENAVREDYDSFDLFE